MPYVEPLSDTRTQVGEMRVAARPGWAGEKDGSFKILLEGVIQAEKDSLASILELGQAPINRT